MLKKRKRLIQFLKYLFSFIFLGIGIGNTIYSFYTTMSLEEIFQNLIKVTFYLYIPISLGVILIYELYFRGNKILLNFYYTKIVPWISLLAKSDGFWSNKLYKFIGKFTVTEHLDLVAESVYYESQSKKYQDWVFSASNSKRPLITRMEHLEAKDYLINWEFSMLLILSKNIRLIRQNNKNLLFEIDLRKESFGIYNNAGKAFLREKFLNKGYIEEAARKSLQISKFVSKKSKDFSLEIETSQFPIRWASGGVIPIIKWKGKHWYGLVFRGIHPTGWNIANGGSESKEEYRNIYSLFLREFFEEFMILSRKPKLADTRTIDVRVFDPSAGVLQDFPIEHTKKVNSISFQEKHIELRKIHNGLNFNIKLNKKIKFKKLDCPYSLRLQYEDEKLKPISKEIDDLIIIADFINFAIECCSVYYFEMEEENYPMFGEIWDVANCLVYSPILFLSCDYVKKEIQSNGGLGLNLNDGSDIKIMSNLTENDFHIFTGDIDFKKERLDFLKKKSREKLTKKEGLELEFHEKWLNQFDDNFKSVIEEKTSINTVKNSYLRQLCPVTWRVIEEIHEKNVYRQV